MATVKSLKQREYRRRYYERHPEAYKAAIEYNKKYNLESYYWLKAHGLCVKCKQESRPGKIMCQACQDKESARQKTNRMLWQLWREEHNK